LFSAAFPYKRRRNRMKTSFIAMMLIVTAALFYVMVV
jgi:hypothetical protein